MSTPHEPARSRWVECHTHGQQWPERPLHGFASTCPECISEERKRREEVQRREEMLREAGLGARFLAATFATFKPATPAQQKALDLARTFAESLQRTEGQDLILSGPVGVGKSHLAAAAVHHVIRERGMGGTLCTATELVRSIRATWARDAKETEEQAIERFARVTLLALDDIGAGLTTDNAQQHLLDVLDARYRLARPILCTTNLTPAELRAAIGPRAFDRLRDGATLVTLDGSSYRGRRPSPGDAKQ